MEHMFIHKILCDMWKVWITLTDKSPDYLFQADEKEENDTLKIETVKISRVWQK